MRAAVKSILEAFAIGEGQMIAIAPHLKSIVDQNGAVILDIPRNTMIRLDATGSYVWARLMRGLQIDAIVTELAQDTGAPQEMISRDVNEFMADLQSRHLLCTAGLNQIRPGE